VNQRLNIQRMVVKIVDRAFRRAPRGLSVLCSIGAPSGAFLQAAQRSGVKEYAVERTKRFHPVAQICARVQGLSRERMPSNSIATTATD